MSAEPAPLRRLAAVDLNSGEVVDPEVVRLQERIANLEQALREAEADLVTKRAMVTRLKRDKAEERTKYDRRGDVVKVHQYWQRRLGTKKALTADRFDAIKGMLEETRLEIVDQRAQKVFAFEFPADFKRAVDGAWFDPFSKVMKNGRTQKFDDLALIFRDAKTMQSFIDRAPDFEERSVSA